MPLLEVRDLQAGYGKMRVLSGVSLSVSERELVAVVGPNGSGKSTLLKAVFGLCTIFSGSILFKGVEVTNVPPHRKSLMGLGYLPQVGNTFEGLTVRENLFLALHDGSYRLEERLEKVLNLLPELKSLLGRRVKTLSGGERQMVALAMCLLRNPSLVMFDEPTTALAPRLVRQVIERIASLKDELGVAIVLVEQNARAALEVCDRALLLVSGTVKFFGDAEDLLSNRELARVYLGLEGCTRCSTSS